MLHLSIGFLVFVLLSGIDLFNSISGFHEYLSMKQKMSRVTTCLLICLFLVVSDAPESFFSVAYDTAEQAQQYDGFFI